MQSDQGSSAPGDARYFIRPMKDEDIPQVLNIDHEAFATQWPPLSYGSLKQELRNRMAHYIVLCTRPSPAEEVTHSVPPATTQAPVNGLWHQIRAIFQRNHQASAVATISPSLLDTVIGFAGIWKMMDEAHLISIAVKAGHRGQGCGEMLLIAVIQMAIELGARVVTLEVRVSNRVAQALYVKYGLRTAGVRHGYYSDNNEDALIMTTDSIVTDEFRAYFKKLREAHAKKWKDLYQA